MPAFIASGPVLCYVRCPRATTALLLGTSEQAPEVEIVPHYGDVPSDLYGRSVAGSQVFDGCDAVVKLLLSRWSPKVVDNLLAQPYTAFSNNLGTPGVWGRLAVGSPTYRIGSYELLLVNAFMVKWGQSDPDTAGNTPPSWLNVPGAPTFDSNPVRESLKIPYNAHAGIRFPNARVAHVVPGPGGSDVTRFGVVFDCKPLYNPTGTKDDDGIPPFSFMLFDHDVDVARLDPSDDIDSNLDGT